MKTSAWAFVAGLAVGLAVGFTVGEALDDSVKYVTELDISSRPPCPNCGEVPTQWGGGVLIPGEGLVGVCSDCYQFLKDRAPGEGWTCEHCRRPFGSNQRAHTLLSVRPDGRLMGLCIDCSH